ARTRSTRRRSCPEIASASTTTSAVPLPSRHRPSPGRSGRSRTRAQGPETTFFSSVTQTSRAAGERSGCQAGSGGVALGLPPAPRLLRPLRRQVGYLVRVHVEHDLPSAGVGVADRDCGGVLLVDLLAGQVTHEDRLAGHVAGSFLCVAWIASAA